MAKRDRLRHERKLSRRPKNIQLLGLQGAGDELFFAVGQREPKGERVRGGRHFLPGFLHGVGDFVFGGFGGEIGELKLEEDKAKGVFKNTAFWIGGEILFQVQGLDAVDRLVVVANLAQDFTGFLGMKMFEVIAPFEIAGLGHGVAGAGNHPAANVLATRCELEGLAGLGIKSENPGREAPGVKPFARLRNAIVNFAIGVEAVGFVKTLDSAGETGA